MKPHSRSILSNLGDAPGILLLQMFFLRRATAARFVTIALASHMSSACDDSVNVPVPSPHDPTKPPTYNGHVMAYDPVRAQIILFGGVVGLPPGLEFEGSRFSDQTWAWDGDAWTKLDLSGPSARAYAGMAYDETEQAMILFGGVGVRSEHCIGDDFPALCGDTWALDTDGWRLLHSDVESRRYAHAMAYDGAARRTVRIGGAYGIYDGSCTLCGVRGHLEVWDGTEWSRANGDRSRLPATRHQALQFDKADERLIVTSGEVAVVYESAEMTTVVVESVGATLGRVGQTWVLLSLDGLPPRSRAATTYDDARDELVLFGGEGDEELGDTWVFAHDRWQQRMVTGPSPRFGASMAFDTARGESILYGGMTSLTCSSRACQETWRWSGNQWSRAD